MKIYVNSMDDHLLTFSGGFHEVHCLRVDTRGLVFEHTK